MKTGYLNKILHVPRATFASLGSEIQGRFAFVEVCVNAPHEWIPRGRFLCEGGQAGPVVWVGSWEEGWLVFESFGCLDQQDPRNMEKRVKVLPGKTLFVLDGSSTFKLFFLNMQ